MWTLASHIFPTQGAFSANGQIPAGEVRGSNSVDRGLGPMCTDVGVPMVTSPFVEMLRQMSGETATTWKVGLADEDNWHTWRVATLAVFKEPDKVGKVLRHDETVLD